MKSNKRQQNKTIYQLKQPARATCITRIKLAVFNSSSLLGMSRKPEPSSKSPIQLQVFDQLVPSANELKELTALSNSVAGTSTCTYNIHSQAFYYQLPDIQPCRSSTNILFTTV